MRTIRLFLKRMKAEKSYLILIILLSIFTVVGYFSYAMFTVNKEQKEAIRIITGTLPATLSSSDSTFKDNKITVTKDSSKDITITLTNNNERNAKYNFYYKDNISEKVHINYYKDTKDIPPTEEGVVINSKESQSYKLKITNLTSEDITVEFGSIGGLENKELSFPNNGKIIEGIVVEVEKPADNMIPVVYNTTNKRWEKTEYNNPNWYNYDKQEWANAVTVTNGSRSGYQKAEAGEEVKMEDILQMWVWIPRYSYTIKSEDGTNYYGKKEEGRSDEPSQALPGEIDVKFIDVSTTDNGSAQYTNSDTPSGWFTPPGFKFGEKNLSGIWIGKFEPGYMGATTDAEARHDTEEPNKAIIKPNEYSWKGIRVSTLELVSMGITKVGNIYGFDQSTYDSHAAKDIEWVLMSYLTQSKYGKYGNPLYTGENKQVYMNNYNAYMTGCSSGQSTVSSTASCVNQYNVMVDRGNGQGYAGAGASTTGNITGIYDISGGAWEYTMGVLNKMSGNTLERNSGYTGQLKDGSIIQGRDWPLEKYYDLYTTTDTKTACNGSPCKGHVLNETAGWYDDYRDIIDTEEPWALRGGAQYEGKLSGSFGYAQNPGWGDNVSSFRIVLTPNN